MLGVLMASAHKWRVPASQQQMLYSAAASIVLIWAGSCPKQAMT